MAEDVERAKEAVKLTAVEKLMQKLIHLSTGTLYETSGEIRSHFGGVDQDVLNEFRSGEANTGLPSEWSRHYESRAVAAQMIDGSWVGWTYWYGGGKYGEPSSIPWVDGAYDVTAKPVQKVVTEFSRPE